MCEKEKQEQNISIEKNNSSKLSQIKVHEDDNSKTTKA